MPTLSLLVAPVMTKLALVGIPGVSDNISHTKCLMVSCALVRFLEPPLLTWFNFNSSMDTELHPL